VGSYVEGTSALVYHVDGLGSVRAITDSTKAVVQTYESDEFGVPITASGGSDQPFGFTGEQRDSESNLIHLRARSYDPQLGRFIGRDTIPGETGRPATLHRFGYVEGNPVNRTDPSGSKSRSLLPIGCIYIWGMMICPPGMAPPSRPAERQVQTEAPACTGGRIYLEEVNGHRVSAHGPEMDSRGCHVNVAVDPPDERKNDHVRYRTEPPPPQFYIDGLSLGSDPWGAAGIILARAANGTEGPDSYGRPWDMFDDLVGALIRLKAYEEARR